MTHRIFFTSLQEL